MKKKQRNILLAIIFIVLVISVVGILFPQAIVDPNGDDDPDYTPSEEINIGTPVLEINKLLLRYKLEWTLKTPYTVDSYIVLKRINSSSWVPCAVTTATIKHHLTYIVEPGLYEFKVLAQILFEGKIHNSQHSEIVSVEIIPEYVYPVLRPIVPNPNINGRIELRWYKASITAGYRIYRFADGIWNVLVDGLSKGTTEYTDTADENGEYKYYVSSFILVYEHSSNVESVIVDIYIPDPPPDPDILPQNPSIVIDNGAETTNSFEVALSLSCDNAEEMHFRLYGDYWTNWTSYKTTHTLTLCEGYLQPNNIFRIEVVFRNVNGTTYDAGYIDTNAVFDDITYEEPTQEEPPVEPVNGKGTDYTMIYVALGVLFGLIGIGIFLKYRYKNREKTIKSKFK